MLLLVVALLEQKACALLGGALPVHREHPRVKRRMHVDSLRMLAQWVVANEGAARVAVRARVVA